MQSDSAVHAKPNARHGSQQDSDGRQNRVFVEREFLLDPSSLRAQFDWKVARHQGRLKQPAENGIGLSTMFRIPSERVLTRDAVFDFLSQLRTIAAEYLGSRHASTPQIMVFGRGSQRWVEEDPSIAPWRYMCFIGPRRPGPATVVSIQTHEAILTWLPWFQRRMATRVLVGSNDLILYQSFAVQSVLSQPESAELEDQTLVLSGWLW